MIRSLYRTQSGELRQDLDKGGLGNALADSSGFVWVDMSASPDGEAQPILADLFHFHPLAIEDTLQDIHHPKLDDYEQYVYVVLHAVDVTHSTGEIATHEVDAYAGNNYVVTYHHQPIPALEAMWARVQRDPRHLAQGPDMILAEFVGTLVDGYLPVVDELAEAIDDLEDLVLDRPGRESLPRVYVLKRSVSRLRRVLSPQREVVNRLSRDDIAVIRPRSRIYFRDAYDHVVRLYDIIESLRDLLSSVLDIHLSATNNRLNEVMKVLTIVTTILMPMTLIASIYGMNFKHMPGLTSPLGFALTILMMVLIGSLMIVWLRRRRWL